MPIGAVCFDLDRTLGIFDRIVYEFRGEEIPFGDTRPVSLRHGIKETLRYLSESGYTLFLTTSASRPYAEEVLKRTGLDRYFKKTFCKEETEADGHGKNYRPAAREMGFSDEDASAKMVVIGDSDVDSPKDIKDLVFVLDAGCGYDSSILTQTLIALNEFSSSSSDPVNFLRGFRGLWDIKARTTHERTIDHGTRVYSKAGRNLKLGLGYKIGRRIEWADNLEYVWKERKRGEFTAPVARIVAGGNWRKDLQTVRDIEGAREALLGFVKDSRSNVSASSAGDYGYWFSTCANRLQEAGFKDLTLEEFEQILREALRARRLLP